MKIIVAPDSFKGCLSSREAALAVSQGVRDVFPDAEVIPVPVADGGEGTVDALVASLHGRKMRTRVKDPLGRETEAVWGLASDTAIIEMAAASGLPLLAAEERNPWITTTYGTGQLIRAALDAGCKRLLIGIGGSATNDGGTGMLEALGWRFFDTDGCRLPGCGGSLSRIARIDDTAVPQEVRSAQYIVACDVDTPFCGPDGASAVFGPQKGADPEMVERLDAGMRSFAGLVAETTGVSLAENRPGTGAAGGLGGAFLAFLGARLVPGTEMVLEAVGLDALLSGADLVITGEGRIDGQTSKGKLPAGVLRHASALGIPVVAVGGAVEWGTALEAMGFRAVLEASAGLPLAEAMRPAVARQRIRSVVSAFLLRGENID